MRKSFLSIALTAVMVAGVFSALPAGAATQVPDVVQIDDPQGDANTTSGDQVTEAGNVSNVGDLRKIWFSNNAESISVHVQTSATPPAGSVGTLYTVLAAPGEGPVTNQTAGCLQFRVFVPAGNAGGSYQGDMKAKLHDRCNEGTNWLDNGVEGEALIETLDDETGLITLTFPRSYSPLLEDGKLLSAPTARSDALVGTDKVEIPAVPGATNHSHPWGGFRYDDTKVGTDYEIGAGGGPPVIEEPEEDPGKKDEAPAKKGCKKKKGKGKKKGCDKGKGPKEEPKGNPAKCDTYVPGEAGAEAEIAVVTDEYTEEAPLEIPVSMDVAFGLFSGSLPVIGENPFVSHYFQNVQVDPDSETAGLHARFSFSEGEDYDLYLDFADGTEAAHAAGGNQAPAVLGNGTGNGGHSETDAEFLDGVLTSDCGGYTFDLVNALGTGEATLSLWLGDATWDPVAQAEIAP